MTHRERPEAFLERSGHALTSRWQVKAVRLEKGGKRLIEPWEANPGREMHPPRGGLLYEFIALRDATGREIHRFAKRYGLLGVCGTHGLPCGHAGGQCSEPKIVDFSGGPAFTEDLRHWRRWALRFTGTVGLAQSVDRGTLVTADDVEAALGGVEAVATIAARLRSGLPLVTQAHQLALWLNYLMWIADCRRQVVLRNRGRMLQIGDGINPAAPLISALTVELSGVCCARGGTLALCKGCTRPFRPRTRGVFYCRGCQTRRVTLNQQRRRARLRAEGKSARGRPL